MVEGLKRLFVAVALPDEIRMALADQLRELSIPGRVTPPSNWHLTLRFLGPVEQITYERFLSTLAQSDLGPPFRLRIAGIGGFPQVRKATVAWVGAHGDLDRLGEVAELCEDAAQNAGLAPEERPFDPHLTISRIRPPADIGDLVETGGDIDLSWECRELAVFESIMGRGHPRYEPLEFLDLRQ